MVAHPASRVQRNLRIGQSRVRIIQQVDARLELELEVRDSLTRLAGSIMTSPLANERRRSPSTTFKFDTTSNAIDPSQPLQHGFLFEQENVTDARKLKLDLHRQFTSRRKLVLKARRSYIAHRR